MRHFIAAILYILPIVIPSLLVKDNGNWGWVIRAWTVFTVTMVVFLVERPSYRKIHYWGIGVLFVVISVAYGKFQIEWLAWIMAVVWFAGLLLLLRRFILPHNIKSVLWAIVLWMIFAGLAGGVLALAYALLINFSEEEFFIAVTGIVLGVFWLVLAIAYQLIFPTSSQPFSLKTRIGFFAVLIIISAGFAPWILKQYQRSFFPATAPAYPGISEDTPFLCDTLDVSTEPISAEQIQNDYVALLEAAPQKNTLIWGDLAYYTGNTSYAAEFRRSLLQEAMDGNYTAPAQSVKWGQYEAALRTHLLGLINQTSPDLFSAEDWYLLKNWFATINRRAMTVEWVDWLYATAYGKRPQGPYENQEIGVGLLATLMANSLNAPELSEQDQNYLDTVPLGWQNIFRNTDDSYSYQGVWLSNAWWLHNYKQSTNDIVSRNIEQSFQWLLLQALPDGATLTYNINGEPTSLTAYLFGASLLDNPQLSWLAGKTARWLINHNQHLWGEFTIPNFKIPDGQMPNVGSCLMYGNSGVPTKKSVLVPDKIVLRDGWTDDAMVVLSDLRFTGWHRYKATNTIPLIYSNGPIVSERETAEPFWWLPVGRSAFRDKRIPREYLNGLLLPKSGLSAVLWRLTGVGSQWAQNPPSYAKVNTFFTDDSVDMAQITLSDWNGWRYTRTSYLIHDGITLVVDNADGTTGSSRASIIWHLNGTGIRDGNELGLANSQRSAKMVWLDEDTVDTSLSPLPKSDSFLRSPEWELLYTSPTRNHLDFATAFLTGKRADGHISLQRIDQSRGVSVHYTDDDMQVALLHNNSHTYQQDDILGTDGTAGWFIKRQSGRRVCVVNGKRINVTLDEFVGKIVAEDGEPLTPGVQWMFENKRLKIQFDTAHSGCFEVQSYGR